MEVVVEEEVVVMVMVLLAMVEDLCMVEVEEELVVV